MNKVKNNRQGIWQLSLIYLVVWCAYRDILTNIHMQTHSHTPLLILRLLHHLKPNIGPSFDTKTRKYNIFSEKYCNEDKFQSEV